MALTQSSDSRAVCCGTVLLKSQLTIDVCSLQHCSISRRAYCSSATVFFKDVRPNNSKKPTIHTKLWLSNFVAASLTHCVVVQCSSSSTFFIDIHGGVKMGFVRHNQSVPGRPVRRCYFKKIKKKKYIKWNLLLTFSNFCFSYIQINSSKQQSAICHILLPHPVWSKLDDHRKQVVFNFISTYYTATEGKNNDYEDKVTDVWKKPKSYVWKRMPQGNKNK